MNLVALLIAPAVVTYADSAPIRIGVTVVAVVIVVGAVVVSKRRSTSISSSGDNHEERAPETVAG
jgi:K(+)-stimulated pyrophosphate-energized sodium pump